MHDNSALMHDNSFAIKSFDFESRVESTVRSAQLLVLAVALAAPGGVFTKKMAKKPFELSRGAAHLEVAVR